MQKRTLIFSIFLSIIMLFSSASGVFATWFLAEESPKPVNDSQNITLSEFTWEPEQILPSVTPGQNFLDLYQSVLDNIKGGLNSSKDTLESALLRSSNGLVHCSENVQGGNLKHLFITEESRELDFILQYVSDTLFNLYIYKQADTNGAVNVTRIEVYKTILIDENNVWTGQETQVGYATLQYFSNTNVIAIEVSSWLRQL